MNTTTLQVQHRETNGRGQLRRIRSEGKVPGVIYGSGMSGPTNIAIDTKDLLGMLRSSAHAVVEIDVPGVGKLPAMMTDLQKDSLTRQIYMSTSIV